MAMSDENLELNKRESICEISLIFDQIMLEMHFLLLLPSPITIFKEIPL